TTCCRPDRRSWWGSAACTRSSRTSRRGRAERHPWGLFSPETMVVRRDRSGSAFREVSDEHEKVWVLGEGHARIALRRYPPGSRVNDGSRACSPGAVLLRSLQRDSPLDGT